MNGGGRIFFPTMNGTARMPARFWAREAVWATAATALRPLQALLAEPSLLFLLALTVILFRPPGLELYWADRIAFLLLVFVVLLKACLLRQPWVVAGSVTWPMLGLLIMAFSAVLTQPFHTETCSLLVAKFVVPFTLFHLAGVVFRDRASLGRFEIFALLVLAYLSFTAIAWLLGAQVLIFPRYILDETLGIHADRARGPFLQAVANGLSLNLLGLLALDSFRRERLRGVAAFALLAALPVAILATMTRAVWLSFAGSVLVLMFRTSSQRLRRACICMAVGGAVALLAALSSCDLRLALGDRLEERGPVEIRIAVYRAAWEMFQERPLLGWGLNQMGPEIGRRLNHYHLDAYAAHNTYMEILVEYGVAGFALYAWLIWGLFQLGRRNSLAAEGASGGSGDHPLRSLWPVLLGVYLLNGTFVVLNYQFVNGLVFTLAGMLATQHRVTAEPQLHVLPR